MSTLRAALCLSFLGLGFCLGFGACYRPGDLGDTPYLCTSERPACPDGYVCSVSLGVCVRKAASSRSAITASTSAPERVGGCPAKAGKDDLSESEVGLRDGVPVDARDLHGLEIETPEPLDCGP
jgi:hypothetical protein